MFIDFINRNKDFKKCLDDFVDTKGFDRKMIIYKGKGLDGCYYEITFGELIDSLKRTNFKDKQQLKYLITMVDAQNGDLIYLFMSFAISMTDNYGVA